MPFFLLAAWKATRRALIEDQGRAEPCDLGFWQLVAREFPILAQRIGPLRVSSIIIAFLGLVLAAEIALNEATPGPFLTPRWRLLVAVVATVVFVAAWTVIHAVRSSRTEAPQSNRVQRT